MRDEAVANQTLIHKAKVYQCQANNKSYGLIGTAHIFPKNTHGKFSR